MESVVFSLTYAIMIFEVDISSPVNEVCHCFTMAPLSCQVQGSPLYKRKRQNLMLVIRICLIGGCKLKESSEYGSSRS